MSYDRRRGLRPVSPYAIVLALAIALTASFFLPTRAEAKVSDHTVPFPNHMVPTISPSGTTINLFDYWVNSEDHLSVSGSDGINKGTASSSRIREPVRISTGIRAAPLLAPVS